MRACSRESRRASRYPAPRAPGLTVSYNVVPVHDEGGAVIGGMILVQDVSRQKKVEDELRAARELFEGAFENAPVGMALVNAEPDGRGQFIRVKPPSPRCSGGGRPI